MSEGGVRFIDPPRPDDRVVACRVEGQLTAEGMKALVDRIQAVVDRGDKARLYIDMTGYEGFELGAVTEKLKNMRMLWNGFDRYAIVGDDRWVEIWTGIVDPLTPQHIRHFGSDKQTEAWMWLSASAVDEEARASEA